MSKNKDIPVALTIAGNDPSGGAGIEADIKTFAALGVHGVAAITAITVQNTRGVKSVHYLKPEMVVEQVKIIMEDLRVDAVKTGVLGKADIVKAVASIIKEHHTILVVDPIIYAKDGTRLLEEDAINVLVKELLPLTTVVTPNKTEAEKLTKMSIRSIDDAKKAAKYIVEELGANAAVVKGGHIEGDFSVDILYYKGEFREYVSPRVTSEQVHGTGCVFSAAIVAELAKGKNLFEAVNTAKQLITLAIDYRLKIGKGHNLINPSAWIEIAAEKYHIIENIKEALKLLEEHGKLVSKYVPEVQMNLVMALPRRYARSVNDVAGVLGRIVRYGDNIKPVGPIVFGASRHLAKAVLKIMEYDPSIRAAINIKYDEEVIEKAKYLKYKVSYYDRTKEPDEIKRIEGASIPWGIDQAVKRLGTTPDIVYHLGDWGKEPIITVFGKTAIDAVRKLIRILSTP